MTQGCSLGVWGRRTCFAAIGALLVACSTATAATTTTASGTSTTTEDTSAASDCVSPSGGVPWEDGPTATAVVLQDATADMPGVEAVVYPLPDHPGKPWSQWGQGALTGDGRFLSAIGDHQGVDGNSYIFSYDLGTGTLTQIGDVLAIVDHVPGEFGYGKIHAAMIRDRCGRVWMTTYWGSRRGLDYTGSYQGDHLLSIDPAGMTIADHGVMVEHHGVPVLAGWTAGDLLYGEGVDPDGERVGWFVVYDIATGSLRFVDEDEAIDGFRSIAVDAEGRAIYSLSDGALAVYDPAANSRSVFPATVPGDALRAVTPETSAGTIYGVTRNPFNLFALDPTAGTVAGMGAAKGYTTSLALSPDEQLVYMLPDAHGKAWQANATLIAMDVAGGEQHPVIELEPLAEQHLGLRLGGTYDIVFDAEGNRILLGMNASTLDDDSGFGQVVLLVVTLP